MRNIMSAPVFAGFLIMLSIIFIGSIVTALLLQYTSLSESKLPVLTYSINLISLLAGGFVTGSKAKEKGWLYGGIAGLMYGIILYLIAFLAFDAAFSTKTLVSLVGAFASAAIGGIFGVNLTNSPK